MKTVLILHGIASKAGDNWMRWLHDELVDKGYKVLMPQLPNTNHPDRHEWLKAVEDVLKDIDFDDLIIVGHSLGVTTALDLLENENKKLPLFISVSGFYYAYGLKLNDYFLNEKVIDIGKVSKLIGKAVVIHSDDDPYVSQDALKDLAKNLGVSAFVIHKGGHINSERGYTKLPLLLKYIK